MTEKKGHTKYLAKHSNQCLDGFREAEKMQSRAIVRAELEALVAAGCTEITVDEPSMSCYAYREDTSRFVDIFNRTVAPDVGKTMLSTHLCFGNFKGRPVGFRSVRPMLPTFLDLKIDEIHVEMTTREFAELELLDQFAERKRVAVGIIDVKNYYIETVEDVKNRIQKCLKFIPAERLSVAPDCGLSQTARWASRRKFQNMAAGLGLRGFILGQLINKWL